MFPQNIKHQKQFLTLVNKKKKKEEPLLLTTNNNSAANQHFRDFWRITEDWSYDAENSALITGVKFFFTL